MSDLIDRTELIKNIEYSFYDYERVRIDTVTGTFLSELFAPSVDAVEVVRCGNCKWADPCICVVCEEGKTVVCGKFHMHTNKDGFCSYGEVSV